MPSPLPSRSNNYRGALDTRITVQIWNAVLGDIAERLTAAEAVRAEFEALIATGTGQALEVIVANVGPQLAAINAQIVVLQAAVSAAQDVVEQINHGVIPASAVEESASRLWLTPALRDSWNAKATPGQVEGAVSAAVAALRGGDPPSGLNTLTGLASVLGDLSGALADLDVATSKLASDQVWTGAQRHSMAVLTSGATIALALANGNDYSLILAHNAVLANPSDIAGHVGQKGSIVGVNNGTGGYTLSYGSAWGPIGGATAPAIPTAPGAKWRIDYHVAGATRIDFGVSGVGVV